MKIKKVAEVYDSLAEEYDDYFAENNIALAENKVIFEHDMKYLNLEDKIVADFGCGDGLILDYIQPHLYIGIDISQKMLNKCYKKHSEKNIWLENRDMADTNYWDNSVDVVISTFGSFCYAENPREVIKEAHRILRPNGKIFFMLYTPKYIDRESYILNKYNIKDEVHQTYWTVKKTIDYFEPYFKNIKLNGLNKEVDDWLTPNSNINLAYWCLKLERYLNIFYDNYYFLIVEGEVR